MIFKIATKLILYHRMKVKEVRVNEGEESESKGNKVNSILVKEGESNEGKEKELIEGEWYEGKGNYSKMREKERGFAELELISNY